MKKIIALSAFLLTSFLVFAEDVNHSAQDFEGLEFNSTKEAIEAKYGQPDEYRANNYTQYVYYVEDGQYVLLRFNPSSGLLANASVWSKRIEQWPVTDFAKHVNGVAIALNKPASSSTGTEQASNSRGGATDEEAL